MIKRNFTLVLSTVLLLACNNPKIESWDISIIETPETKTTNSHYISNKAPLKPSKLIKLPVGVIKPKGWLGKLNKISAWLQKKIMHGYLKTERVNGDGKRCLTGLKAMPI